MRRVLESLFRYFDNGNLWSVERGIAFPVLKEMQLLMDDSGTLIAFSFLFPSLFFLRCFSFRLKFIFHKRVIKCSYI